MSQRVAMEDGHDYEVHWCWTGAPPPRDTPANDPCAVLWKGFRTRDAEALAQVLNIRRIRDIHGNEVPDTVLLRAGTLAEPIRACGEGWPELSVAVIAADRWRYPEDPDNDRGPRRLAIRLLDTGGADLVVIGPHWREAAEALAAQWAAVEDSQWLYFFPNRTPPSVGQPEDTSATGIQRFLAGLTPEERESYLRYYDWTSPDFHSPWDAKSRIPTLGRARGAVIADPGWLASVLAEDDPTRAGGLSEMLDRLREPGETIDTSTAPSHTAAEEIATLWRGVGPREKLAVTVTLDGQPRLWAGAEIVPHPLPDGSTMDFVRVCPGTFTMGEAGWLDHTLDAAVAAFLRLEPEQLTPDTPLDSATLGSERHAALNEAISSALDISELQVAADDWRRVGTLAEARAAYGEHVFIASGRPAHPVLVGGFELARTETTRAAYRALGKSPRYSEPTDDQLPANPDGWNEVRAFCGALDRDQPRESGDLPTEVQWEYAARASSRGPWFGCYTKSQLHPVGETRPNALGLRDMAGNVWEWTQDCGNPTAYEARSALLQVDPPAESADCRLRVLRGGSFGGEPWDLSSALRVRYEPARRYGIVIGFRCVRSAPPALAP